MRSEGVHRNERVQGMSKVGQGRRVGSLTRRVKWFLGYIDIDLDLNPRPGESEKR
jgi:hypothetical protein